MSNTADAEAILVVSRQVHVDTVPFRRMGKSESQMDIMEKSAKPGKHRSVVVIGLSVLLLLVSCALVGLVVLYTTAVRGERQGTSKLKQTFQIL